MTTPGTKGTKSKTRVLLGGGTERTLSASGTKVRFCACGRLMGKRSLACKAIKCQVALKRLEE